MFENEGACLVALDKIWCNSLLAHANNEERLVGNGAGQDYLLSEIENMPEHEICALKSYAKKNGVIENTEALTEKWAVPWNCVDDTNKWVFQKPDDTLMDGVVGYTIVEYNKAWYPILEQ
jgi:hypothetical protein